MVNLSDGDVKTNFRLSLGAAEDVTLSSDIGAVTRSFVNLISESGATDDCAQLTGLAVGDIVIVTAEAGDTITLKDGANMKMGGDIGLVGTNGDMMVLICTATGACTGVATYSSN